MKTYYKISRVKNSAGVPIEYLQIWKSQEGVNTLVMQVGRADKLLKILVSLKPDDKMTKENPENPTKISEEPNLEND